MTRFPISILAALGACTAWPADAGRPGDEPARPAQGQVTLRANPERICLDDSRPAYLNFDLVIGNGSDSELRVSELRGLVLDAAGQVIERRIIWQQALGQLVPDPVIAPRSEGLIFNPLLFAAAGAGARIRYEVDLAGPPAGTETVSATITPEDCSDRLRLALPLAGRVLVYDGYDLYSHHRRTGYGGPEDEAQGITDNFQRFGIDLVAIDEQGRFFRGDGSRTDQWLGWNLPVRAPATGTVAAMHDGQPDNVAIGTVDRWIDRDPARNPMTSYGNYVLIDHGGGEFTLMGHLRDGSVTVRRGQRVEQGEVVGAVGNSGASGGVHLHFERRSGPGLAGIRTLPPYFQGVTVAGPERNGGAEPVAINSGDVVVAQ